MTAAVPSGIQGKLFAKYFSSMTFGVPMAIDIEFVATYFLPRVCSKCIKGQLGSKLDVQIVLKLSWGLKQIYAISYSLEAIRYNINNNTNNPRLLLFHQVFRESLSPNIFHQRHLEFQWLLRLNFSPTIFYRGCVRIVSKVSWGLNQMFELY